MGIHTKITSSDSFQLSAYQASPEGNCVGAVVVIQEIFGVNSHIRDVVDTYATKGYFAIAPCIFDRVESDVELGYDESAMAQGVKIAFQQLNMEETLKDLQATIDCASQYGKVAVVGYCFGGLLTWLSACQLEGLSAASSYYGGGLVGQRDLAPKCPVIMHFGDRDAHIPLSDVELIKQAQPDLDIYVYEADHGFNCNARESYDQNSASLATRRTLKLFEQYLT